MKVLETEEKDETALLFLLQSLIDSIPNVHSFKGKWSLIGTKLADLKTHITDLSDSPTSTSTASLSTELLRSLSSTLSDALSLSKTCQSPTLPNGKLKTQNDIDSISAKLTRHVTDIDILIKSGVLQDAVISSTSKRESIRVSTRSLLTRLQIGTTESKSSALESLISLLNEDDKNVLISVAQGVVPVLVRLIDNTTSSSSYEIREKAVSAIARISSVDSSKHVLIAEGNPLIQGLIRVIESGSGGYAKENACIALKALSQTRENARAIGSRGGISSLLEICQAGTPGSQAVAAAVLRNLAGFVETREMFIQANAILILLGLLSSGTVQAQENAIGCLCSLVEEDEGLKLVIFKEGGIDCLMSYWDSCSDVRCLEVAIELVRSLVSCHLIAETIVANGFLSRIVWALDCGVVAMRVAGARAVHDLGLFSMKTRKELGEIGCVSPLVGMLEGKGVEEKEAAAKALAVILGYGGNTRIFRKEGRGIVSAVQLLDPLIKNLEKKYPVSLLLTLVHSKKCRRQMVASGALVYLPKVVDKDVEGAKKLLQSLGRGKLWGVFARP